MKKIHLIALSLIIYHLSFSSAAAQSARDDFKNDTHLSASNYLAYPGPTQGKLTPAPDGKKPFYISHYGRHGSRYLINPSEYKRPMEKRLTFRLVAM